MPSSPGSCPQRWPAARRVLYVMPVAEMGGAERATLLLVEHHDPARYVPVVLFLNDGPLVTQVRELGATARVFEGPLRLRRPWQIARAVMKCRDVIEQDGISLVSSCMAYAHIVGAAAARLAGVPACLFQHGPIGGIFDGMARMLPPARVLANSMHTRALHETVWGRSRPIDLIPLASGMAPSSEALATARAAMERELALSPDDRVAGTVARLDPQKGIGLALEAAAPLLRSRVLHRFLVVGGPFRHFWPHHLDELKAIAAREGVGDSVIFTGFREDPLPYLARMDVFVAASRTPEGFGLAPLEAMAAGVPVVAAATGGLRELVTDQVDGLLFTPGDAAGLGAALKRLLTDGALRARLSAAARRTARDRHSPSIMVEAVQSAYDATCDGTGAMHGR